MNYLRNYILSVYYVYIFFSIKYIYYKYYIYVTLHQFYLVVIRQCRVYYITLVIICVFKHVYILFYLTIIIVGIMNTIISYLYHYVPIVKINNYLLNLTINLVYFVIVIILLHHSLKFNKINCLNCSISQLHISLF